MAPIGNKNALGNKGGRPRTKVPEKEELIELGKKLVEWAEKKHEEGEDIRVRFCDWYTAEGFIMKQWESMRAKPEFEWYYERARSIMALRYVDGTVNQSIAHRYLRIYDPEVRYEENEKMKYEYDLKAKAEQGKYDPEALKQLEAIMDQIKSSQSLNKKS